MVINTHITKTLITSLIEILIVGQVILGAVKTWLQRDHGKISRNQKKFSLNYREMHQKAFMFQLMDGEEHDEEDENEKIACLSFEIKMIKAFI